MLFALLKAPLAGFFVTLLISAILGRLEGPGTFLFLHSIILPGIEFFWSWPVFLVSVALSFAVFWITE